MTTSEFSASTSRLQVTVWYTVTDAPAMPFRYAWNGAMYQPQTITMDFSATNTDGDQPPRDKLALSAITICGQRIRKDGSLGAEHHERFYSFSFMGIEWATDVASQVLARLQAGE